MIDYDHMLCWSILPALLSLLFSRMLHKEMVYWSQNYSSVVIKCNSKCYVSVLIKVKLKGTLMSYRDNRNIAIKGLLLATRR